MKCQRNKKIFDIVLILNIIKTNTFKIDLPYVSILYSIDYNIGIGTYTISQSINTQ